MCNGTVAFAGYYAVKDKSRRRRVQFVLIRHQYGSEAPKQSGFCRKSDFKSTNPVNVPKRVFLRLYLPFERLQ